MKNIITNDAPAPKGTYSHARVHQGLVYVAGQLGLNPATGEVSGSEFTDQLRQALENLETILKASGSDLEHILHINVYLTDPNQYPLMNKIFTDLMPQPYPPRTARVVELGGYLVEVDAVAALIE